MKKEIFLVWRGLEFFGAFADEASALKKKQSIEDKDWWAFKADVFKQSVSKQELETILDGDVVNWNIAEGRFREE